MLNLPAEDAAHQSRQKSLNRFGPVRQRRVDGRAGDPSSARLFHSRPDTDALPREPSARLAWHAACFA
jgi:hypothetical protein